MSDDTTPEHDAEAADHEDDPGDAEGAHVESLKRELTLAFVETHDELAKSEDEGFRAFAEAVAGLAARAEREGVAEAVYEGIRRLEEEEWRRRDKERLRLRLPGNMELPGERPYPPWVAFSHAEEFFRPGSEHWLDIAPGEDTPKDRAVRLVLSRMRVARKPLDAFRYAIDRANTIAEGLTHGKVVRVLAADLERDGAKLDDNARDRLSDALRSSVRAFLEAHELRGDAWLLAPIGGALAAKVDALAEEEGAPGVLFLDEWFARQLESIARRSRLPEKKRAGAALAKRLRAGSAERVKRARGGETSAPWAHWFAPADGRIGLPWLEALTGVLWRDLVEPQLRHEEANPTALVIQVHEEVTRIHSRAHMLETRSGQRSLIYDEETPVIMAPPEPATIDASEVLKLVEKGAGLLWTKDAHRLLRWQLTMGTTRAHRLEPDARVLRVPKGWQPFAEEDLGIRSKSAGERVRAVAYAQAAVMFPLPDGGRANMVQLTDIPSKGRGRPGRIEFVLGTMLLPHYGYELEGSLSGRQARESIRLVPIPAALPPMVGRERDHGALVTFSMLLVRELRVRARELYLEGCVELPPERLAELARKARLPLSTVADVMKRWSRDGGAKGDLDDAPAFLEQPKPGRYALGKAHAAERAFLEAAGRMEQSGAEAGRRSVEARAAKRRRLDKGERP